MIVYDGVMPGSTARLMCDEGYTASEETCNRICLCNGVWSEGTQICEKIGEFIICLGMVITILHGHLT